MQYACTVTRPVYVHMHFLRVALVVLIIDACLLSATLTLYIVQMSSAEPLTGVAFASASLTLLCSHL